MSETRYKKGSRGKKAAEPMTHAELVARSNKGDWSNEIVAAWTGNGRDAVAEELAQPDLSHYVLVWICGVLQERGADLDELSNRMEKFEPID